VKIAVVNDVPMVVEVLSRIVRGVADYHVIWTAANGAEAVDRCRTATPDVILMDLFMPVLDGVEATRRIMASSPCAILVVTASVDGQVGKVFEALGAGALDAVATPSVGVNGTADGASLLLAKIRALGLLLGVGAPRRPSGQIRSASMPRASSDCLVALGASAGGPAAVATVLRSLPATFAASVVVLQHVDAQFIGSMAHWLGQQSALPVRVAEPGDRLIDGTVLLAGGNGHLVCRRDVLEYVPAPLAAYQPSIDAFFDSVAAHWTGSAVAVLLTGMGRDGASGLRALRLAGALTIAQDRASSVVYGMPQAAVELDAASEVLPLDRVGQRLTDIVHSGLHPLRNRP
jgi:two-component system response regulator WspF